jgi:hypothetical protein
MILWIDRVRHGYTAGTFFPHRTCTRRTRTRNGTGMVFVGYGCGVARNPRFFPINNLNKNLKNL